MLNAQERTTSIDLITLLVEDCFDTIDLRCIWQLKDWESEYKKGKDLLHWTTETPFLFPEIISSIPTNIYQQLFLILQDNAELKFLVIYDLFVVQ